MPMVTAGPWSRLSGASDGLREADAPEAVGAPTHEYAMAPALSEVKCTRGNLPGSGPKYRLAAAPLCV